MCEHSVLGVLLIVFTSQTIGLSLSGSSLTAENGVVFSLVCTLQDRWPLWTAHWSRNGDHIFTTHHGLHSPLGVPNSGFPVVAGRIRVDSGPLRHSVHLRVDMAKDNGSVWSCQRSRVESNKLTIIVIEQEHPERNRASVEGIVFGCVMAFVVVLILSICMVRAIRIKGQAKPVAIRKQMSELRVEDFQSPRKDSTLA